MSDLLDGSVTASTGNAVVNAGGKLLKIAELQLRFGTSTVARPRELLLVPEND